MGTVVAALGQIGVYSVAGMAGRGSAHIDIDSKGSAPLQRPH